MNLPWSPFTFTQFFSFNLLIFPLFLIFPMATKAFQPQNGEPDRSSCGDQFDVGLRRQCMRGEWEEKYYFEHGSQTCRLFWYDGCPSSSGTRNFFDSLLECQWLCEPGLKASNCLEPFDEHLRDECKQGAEWRRRFYFDRNKLRCVSFWFDGCESGSRNQFDEEQECLQQCEMPATQATKKLLNRPDTQSTISIHPTSSQFVPAWRMIGQTTTNSPLNKVRAMDQRITMANDLRESTQRSTFLMHPSTRPNNKWNTQKSPNEPITLTTRPSPQLPPFTPIQTSNHRLHSSMTMTSNSPKMPQPYSPRMTQQTTNWQQHIRREEANICERANPCKNNGTCVWDAILKQHICRCAPGFTNDNCTERIDFDPCSPDPCQNGATCAAKVGADEQTQYDCYCTRGYAGKHCELKPCEENPCKNGGTCRTTRSTTLFFCACPPGWGGKTCMIAIPPSAEGNDELAQPDANFTQQLSSGKIEWIEHLRKITPKMPTTTIKNESTDSFEREYSTSEEEDGLVSRRSKDAPSTASEFVVGEENPTRTLKGSNSQEQFYDKKNSAAKWWRPINWPIQILTIFILFLVIH